MSVEDRSWMYQGWSDNGYHSEDWVRNTDAFLDLAFSSVSNAERSGVPCPCTDCRNGVRQRRAVLRMHLCKRGFMPGYTRWTEHGESPASVPTAGHARNTPDGLDKTLADVGDAVHADSVEEEPTADAKAFSAMSLAAQEPLHNHTSLPQLTAVAHLMTVMSRHNDLTEESIDAFLGLLDDILPENHKMPKTVNECKSLLSSLKRPHDACVDNCKICNQEGQSKEECDQSEEESSDC